MVQLFKLILLQFVVVTCGQTPTPLTTATTVYENKPGNIKQGIGSIILPAGFRRQNASQGSFTIFLRNVKLKKDNTVYLYNGQPKRNQFAQYAVLDISIGNADLQQCADAVMRLRAEYLFEQKDYEKIVFYDHNKKAYPFAAPFTPTHLSSYLKRVFGMCGSASLAKQLKPVTFFKNIQPGDVIIRGGFPGHAVIVMDVASNTKGEKIFLLAQSYMPAQDIHVLVNPTNPELSPWYEVNDDLFIQTPEYTFTKNELKSW